jgi:hypothetical protein
MGAEAQSLLGVAIERLMTTKQFISMLGACALAAACDRNNAAPQDMESGKAPTAATNPETKTASATRESLSNTGNTDQAAGGGGAGAGGTGAGGTGAGGTGAGGTGGVPNGGKGGGGAAAK